MKKILAIVITAVILVSMTAVSVFALVPEFARTDNEADGYAALNSIDGDTDTIWHTIWGEGQQPLPISIFYDLGAEYTITGVTITPRQDSNLNGLIYCFNLYVSDDDVDYTLATSVDYFEYSQDPQTATFDTAVKGRYVQIEATDTEGGFVSICEIEFAVAETETPVASVASAEETPAEIVEESTETTASEETLSEEPKEEVVVEEPITAEPTEEKTETVIVEAPQTGDPIIIALLAAAAALGSAIVSKRR